MNYYRYISSGFTLVEILIVISIFIILAAVSIPIYSNWQNSTVLHASTVTIKEALELVKARSKAGYNNISHGVYFDVNASSSDAFTIYQGSNYLSREPAHDLITELDEVLNLTTSLADNEINYSKGLGRPNANGNIILTNSNTGNVRNIFINSLGVIDIN